MTNITTPTSTSYIQARIQYILKSEGSASAIYLDGTGYPTIGYGFLLLKERNKPASLVASVITHSPDVALTGKVMAALVAAGRDKTAFIDNVGLEFV